MPVNQRKGDAVSCGKFNFLDKLMMILVVVGALNWGIQGILEKDLIMGIIGLGWSIARIVYIVVGVAGLWTLLFTLPKTCK